MTFPGGYKRWPSLRKGAQCELQLWVDTKNWPNLRIKYCAKPAKAVLLIADLYMNVCAECLKRKKTDWLTRDEFLAAKETQG